MDFSLSKTDEDTEWNALVNSSAQGSIFSDSRYLQSLGAPYTRYLVKTPHGEILAGVVIMEHAEKMHVAPFPFTPYQGIMFSASISRLPAHKKITLEFRLTEFFINELLQHYRNFSMALSPAFDDLRPFLWHAYHAADVPHFDIRNRYTAILDLTHLDQESYLKTVRAVRRQEYKKSKAVVTESTDIESFIALYRKTFARQELTVFDEHIALIRRIGTSALEGSYGKLSMASLAEEGDASMSLFIFDQRCAYYLFGANAPELRNTGASTHLMIDNIFNLAERGLSKLDFVGINSPNRGDFKLSFNAELKAYHEVNLQAQ